MMTLFGHCCVSCGLKRAGHLTAFMLTETNIASTLWGRKNVVPDQGGEVPGYLRLSGTN